MGYEFLLTSESHDIYHRVRCGLVHTYFIKGASRVKINAGSATTGLTLNRDTSITFAVKRYYTDYFKAAIDYRDALEAGNKIEDFRNAITFLERDAQSSSVGSNIYVHSGVTGRVTKSW